MQGTLAVITTPTRYGLGKGHAFEWFERSCPQLRFVYLDVNKNWLAGLKGCSHAVILGHKAYSTIFPNRSIEKDLCTRLKNFGIPTTVTFHPQDAYDSAKNEDDTETASAEKDISLTRRENYRFWISHAVNKLLHKPYKTYNDRIVHAPRADEIINICRSANSEVFLDIETTRSQELICFAFAVGRDSPVYVVPVYRYDGKLFYSNFHQIYRALAGMLARCKLVVHNSLFDLFILSWKYRIPVSGDVFDTMLCQHRCYPEIEKSLGHAIALWTWREYHKDMAAFDIPKTAEQEYTLWQYNALDVAGMRDVYYEQLEYIKGDSGLLASVQQANDSVYPYLCAMLHGIAYNELKLLAYSASINRRLRQLLRIGRILSGLSDFNPNSSQQAINFFHKKLGYSVVGRTDSGSPSLGYGELLRLRLKYDNPLIEVILAYRLLRKELSMLIFTPYETV